MMRLSHALLKFGLMALGAGVSTACIGDGALADAARVGGVPEAVVLAIVRQESGGSPHCINTNSDLGSLCFSSRAAAAKAIELLMARGYTNLDIGLGQINIRSHPELARRPSDLLDPAVNLRAVGAVLRKKKAEGAKSLAQQVGWYHSRTDSRAQRYAAAVLTQSNYFAGALNRAVIPGENGASRAAR